MANSDDIVKKVVIEGDDEAAQKFNLLADVLEGAFGRMGGAVRAFAGLLTGPIGLIVTATAAVVALAAAVTHFAETQAKAQIQLNNLAKAFGVTRDEMSAFQTELAKAGLSQEEVATTVQRMAQRIGAAWSQIAQETRKGPLAFQEAKLGIENAQNGISTAMTNQAFASREWANRLTANALAVTEAYKRVQRSAEDAANQTTQDALGVRGAQLSVREAELNARGGGSDADKAALAKEKSQLALDQANQTLADAELKQARNIQDQPDRQRQAQLGLDQARTTQAKDAESAGPAIQKAATDFESASLQFKQAVDRMTDVQLHDLPTVIAAIQNKNGEILKDVSSETFAHAVQQLAQQEKEARGEQGRASGVDVALQLSKVFQQLGEIIEAPQRLSVEQQLGAPRQGVAAFDNAIANLTTTLPPAIAKAVAEGAGGSEQNQANAEAVISSATSLEDIKATSARLAGTSDTISGIATETKDIQIKISETLQNILQSISGNNPLAAGGTVTEGGTGGGSFASGGFVSGPGSATSDSIPARLSNGEFVVQAAAVRAYGASLFHNLNNMAVRGFAGGGFVGPGITPLRFAEGGAVSGQNVINLHIDGQKFEGLRASEGVASSLQRYAVGRQTASTGRKPGWMR